MIFVHNLVNPHLKKPHYLVNTENYPIVPSVHFLYPLNTSKNQQFSDTFSGYIKGTHRAVIG